MTVPLPAPAPQTIGWVFGGDLSQIPPPPRYRSSELTRARPEREAQSPLDPDSPTQACANPNELRSVSLASWIPQQAILAQAGITGAAAMPEGRSSASPASAAYIPQASRYQSTQRIANEHDHSPAEGSHKPQLAGADEDLHSLAPRFGSGAGQDRLGMSPSLVTPRSAGPDVRASWLQQGPPQDEPRTVHPVQAKRAYRSRPAQEAFDQHVPRPRRAAPPDLQPALLRLVKTSRHGRPLSNSLADPSAMSTLPHLLPRLSALHRRGGAASRCMPAEQSQADSMPWNGV